ncbi:hypothetical protein N9Q05_00055 [bacterium]|nr:hypothetical protein [bacterium]
MSKFNDFKVTIFSDPNTQTALMNAVCSKGYSAANFDEAYAKLVYKVDEHDLQIILAPFLRALAIKHLREGETAYVKEFRSQYDAVVGALDTIEPGDAMDLAAFLNQQSQAGIYATDIDAGALAEALGVTFACTQVGNNNFASMRACIYYRSAQEDAAIIHLYNRPGNHFFVVDGQYQSTFGDGNCLYNGFTQCMRQLILEEEQSDINVYINQEKIYSKIKNLPAMLTAELVVRVRMQHIKKADESDHKTAIQVALDDEKPKNLPKASIKKQMKSDEILSKQKQSLLSQIDLIRQQGVLISDEVNQLATTLEDLVKSFFIQSHQDRKNGFFSFKKEFLREFAKAKSWLNYRDYQQIFLNIVQTLTVIGALLGVAQWLAVGRYTLFPTSTTTLLEGIEQTTQKTLMELT